MKQEFSGSFEMINDEIEQEFQASNANGAGKFIHLFFFRLILISHFTIF